METDVLVVGGGVLGFSSAYHMKRRRPDDRIVLIDRLGGPGQGNSAKSEGAFRNVFTSKTNYLLADSTIDAFTHFQRDLGYDLKMENIGYLWLFSEEQHRRIKPVLDSMTRLGVELRFFDEGLTDMIPGLVTDFTGDEEAEVLGLEPVDVAMQGVKCGSIDADSLVRCYERMFLEAGGEVVYGADAEKLILEPMDELGIPGEPFVWQDAAVKGAETSKGEIRAGTTVVATGAWAERLLDPIGVDSMMRPKKRHIFVFKDLRLRGLFEVKGLNELGALPLTVLPKSGVYLKAEVSEGSIWVGCADNLGRRFGLEDDPKPEESYYTDDIYHVLVEYLPCFKDVRPVNMWAGQYAINGYDGIPVVAPALGMIYVGAASGSGIMKSDALGRVAAALNVGEPEAELYGGRGFRVAALGGRSRRVEREEFII
jgi:FAD-dependent oxidoreductase domain-containing protein 1